jgi:putative ABC transport system permease protein
VAVINETMARRFFPGQDPIGKRFKFGNADSKSPYISVVGVVGDMRVRGLDKQTVSQVFEPLAYEPDESMELVVRTTSDPLKLAGAVRREIQSVEKGATVFSVNTAKAQLEQLNSQRSFQTWLLGLFSFVALALAAAGVYGVMSYAVTQRTHEIGVRVALGAQRRHILGLVVRQGMTSVLVGLGAGLLGALWITPVLASLLYGVSAADPFTYTGIAMLLVCTALLACYVPARRATRVDPTVALRYE